MGKKIWLLTETDKKLAAFRPSLVNRIQFGTGIILLAAGFISLGFRIEPHWLSLILGVCGGYLIARGRGLV